MEQGATLLLLLSDLDDVKDALLVEGATLLLLLSDLDDVKDALLVEGATHMQEKVEPQRKKKCTFKKRKATHTIRKEQKAALEKEIEAL
ncbi:uncharacterized protein IUM83_13057 [Phytophthora cinnamomi]|uniref:uncharacterized protein n=1 Tax=Phytophthora cinnamomi TaxID=4785 RepID=UPI00355A31B3|nr:hypothetical protein IUM83_13057 [Phytophthora cinnamomi]